MLIQSIFFFDKIKIYNKEEVVNMFKERNKLNKKIDCEKVLELECSDETLVFIAGYTPGEVTYGITHEELEADNLLNDSTLDESFEEEISAAEVDILDLPF